MVLKGYECGASVGSERLGIKHVGQMKDELQFIHEQTLVSQIIVKKAVRFVTKSHDQ